MRKRTGLHNRNRSGRSTYSIKRKGLRADRYGTYVQGHLVAPESVAGASITKQLALAKPMSERS